MLENKSPLAVLTGSAPARDKVVSVNFVTENYATQNSLMTIFSRWAQVKLNESNHWKH